MNRTPVQVENARGVTARERSARPIAAGVDILGFDVVSRMPDALFLSSGGYHHHLGFNTWESKGGTPPPPGTTGMYHPTRATLVTRSRRLLKEGATRPG